MRVDGASVIVSWENRLEGCDAVVVRGLDAAQERGFVAGGFGAGVDTRGVAVPHVDVDGGHGEAGCDVEVLHFEV